MCVFICSETCRPAPGPTEPPIYWIPVALSLEVEQVACEVPSVKVKNEWSFTSTCPGCLHTVLLQLSLHLLQSFRAYYMSGSICAMAQVISYEPVTRGTWVQSQAVCLICGGPSGTGAGFSSRTSTFPCHHYTIAPCSSITKAI